MVELTAAELGVLKYLTILFCHKCCAVYVRSIGKKKTKKSTNWKVGCGYPSNAMKNCPVCLDKRLTTPLQFSAWCPQLLSKDRRGGFIMFLYADIVSLIKNNSTIYGMDFLSEYLAMVTFLRIGKVCIIMLFHK